MPAEINKADAFCESTREDAADHAGVLAESSDELAIESGVRVLSKIDSYCTYSNKKGWF